MEDRFVTYRGVRMAAGWPARIEEAQRELTYDIGGLEYRRIPYGSEADDWGAEHAACHDCRVMKGELHVPSCDVEQCPACGGQVIGCDCPYDGDEESEE